MNLNQPLTRIFLGLGLLSLALAAAGFVIPQSAPQVSEQTRIEEAVAPTLASIPSPAPSATTQILPSATPFSLKGLYCQYEFCIGHPQDLYLLDQGATRQPPIPSTYGYGILFSYNQSIFLQIAWTLSGPTFDPQTTMRFIKEENEEFSGAMQAKLMGKYNVYYNAITNPTTLPAGGIAAWQCGGRDFVWKVYTPQDGAALGLLQQAIEKFRCQEEP